MTAVIFATLASAGSTAAQTDGQDLLAKTILAHDPQGAWATLSGQFDMHIERDGYPPRTFTFVLENELGDFHYQALADGHSIAQGVRNGECYALWDGLEIMADSLRQRHQLTCERSRYMQDVYTYLYGLPMKLADAGTIVDPEARRAEFAGQDCWVLRVHYEAGIGDDVWYFYIHPEHFRLLGYRFYHDEAKGDGEFIVLEGMEASPGGVLFPKVRKWHWNKNGSFFRTDYLKAVR